MLGQPEDQPDESQTAQREKRGLPTPTQGQPRHQQRREHRADVAAGIENAVGQRAFVARKPFGDRFYRCRKIPRLAQPQGKPCRAEPDGGPCQAVCHRRDAPGQYGNRISFAGTDEVNPVPKGNQPQRVGGLERDDDVRVLGFAPADFALQRRRQQTEDLPVHVIDGGRQEEQATNNPAPVADGGCARGRHGSGAELVAAAAVLAFCRAPQSL